MVSGTSSAHQGFISDVTFTRDSSKLISVDTGHTGAYEVSQSRKI